MNDYDVVIIGGGQAGLAMGYYLKQQQFSFILLDKNDRIGDSWRQRYDSLVLFTPRKYSSLPGLAMEGVENDFPTKEDMATYLENYVNHFELPVKGNTEVKKLRKQDSVFHIETNNGVLRCKQVIVATGAFQKPYIPVVSNSENQPLYQLHSSQYRSPKNIPGNSVLVVGGGNSGAQIAVELSKEKNVTIAIGHPFKFLPLHLFGKSIFSLLDKLGLLYAGVDTWKGKWFQKQSDPIFGKELKTLLKNKTVLIKSKVVSVTGNEVLFEDDSKEVFDSIIWSTGFVPSYDWIHIDGVLSVEQKPTHTRGVTEVKGLYFLGLPWQYQRGSALICGVGRDAEYLVSFIVSLQGSN